MDSSSPPVVLIVEDEELVREVATIEFEDAGFQVIEAGDGDTAVGLLASDVPIDLLFTDIRLPGSIDGWAIADFAREVRPDLPVIYATGFSGDAPRLVPGSRFFKKPYRPVAIIEAARAMMG